MTITPERAKRHSRLWNGGNAENIGCEYGEHC